MRVRVLFFGLVKELIGKESDTIDLPHGACAGDVLLHYEEQVPRLKQATSFLAIAVNQRYAGSETPLHPDDEVAILPPVSGGSGEARSDTRRRAIVRARIDSRRICDALKRGEDGAIVVFEGIVRNQTRGRETLYLDYEAYEDMALQQIESLAADALRQFQIRDVVIVHRLGRIEIGETSVLIAVVSAHRGAAFGACRWLIDTLKRTVPIWKKEYFKDGAVWADGEPFPVEILRAKSET
jgi:MoaE-MoaD fusion protein